MAYRLIFDKSTYKRSLRSFNEYAFINDKNKILKIYCFSYNNLEIFNYDGSRIEKIASERLNYLPFYFDDGKHEKLAYVLEMKKNFYYDLLKLDVDNFSNKQTIGEIQFKSVKQKILTGSSESKSVFAMIIDMENYDMEAYEVYNNSIQKLVTNRKFLSEKIKSLHDIKVAKLKVNADDKILIRSKTGIDIYGYDHNDRDFKFEKHLKCNCDYFFVANLTKSKSDSRDLVCINSYGISIYQYSNEDFQLFDSYEINLQEHGWRNFNYESIKFYDIDNDGRDEMLVTTPKGLKIYGFNIEFKKWYNLLDTVGISISNLYGTVEYIGQLEKYKNPIVFIKNQHLLEFGILNEFGLQSKYLSNVDASYNPNYVDEFNEETSLSTNKIDFSLDPIHIDKHDLFTIDQFSEYVKLFNSINKHTGQVQFNLPLTNINNLKLNIKTSINYDGNNHESGVLGKGWSLPRIDYILLDHQTSIYDEDHKYFLISEIQPVQLDLIENKPGDSRDLKRFKINNQTDVEIEYNEINYQWIIRTKDDIRIYGLKSNAIKWNLSWKHWRGFGNDVENKTVIPTQWYLTEIHDNYGMKIEFEYENEISQYHNTTYTVDVHLKKITYDTDTYMIFYYLNKINEEYKDNMGREMNGVYIPEHKSKRYLDRYEVITPTHKQEIQFKYNDVLKNNGNRLLTAIIQHNNEKFLEFGYDSFNNNVMNKIDFPLLDSHVDFTYKKIGQRYHTVENYGKKFGIDEFLKFEMILGEKFFVFTSLKHNYRLNIEMYDTALNPIYPVNNDNQKIDWPTDVTDGNSVILAKLLENGFVITLISKTKITLHLFRKNPEQNIWKIDEKTNFYQKLVFENEELKVHFGSDFIIVHNPKLMKIISWNKIKENWKVIDETKNLQINDHKFSVIQPYNRRFFVYDDKDVTVAYRRIVDGEWQYKKIIMDKKGYIKGIHEILSKFNMRNEEKDIVFERFKEDVLKVHQNLLSLNTLKADGTKFTTELNLFVLDSKFNVIKETQKTVQHNDIAKLEKKVDFGDRKMILSYKLKNDKYVLNLVKYDDRTGEEIRIEREKIENSLVANRDAERNKLNEIVNQMFENIENLKEFLLDISQYLIHFNYQMLVCDNKKFTFTGNDWKEEQISIEQFEQSLGQRYILKKNSYTNQLEIIDKEDYLLNKSIDLDRESKLSVQYPTYIAYKSKNSNNIQILEFTNWNEIGQEKSLLIKEEILPSFCNPYYLVTIIKSLDDSINTEFAYELRVRPQYTIERLSPNIVVDRSNMQINNGKINRLISYRYNLKTAVLVGENHVFYKNVTTIPGDDVEKFGYIEDSIYGEKRIYNAQKRLLKEEIRKEEEEDEEGKQQQSEYENSVLYDKSKQLEVATFYPYKLNENVIGYYGFEDYELNTVDGKQISKRWEFNENEIKKDQFSLTGRNHLHLKNSSIIGKFSPQYSNQKYVVSAWMRSRSKDLFQIGELSAFLKAQIKPKKPIMKNDSSKNKDYWTLSIVKSKLEGWYYLEIIIDLLYFKEMWFSSKNNFNDDDNSLLFDITVMVISEESIDIDVDNIRFFPLKCPFEVSVYDLKKSNDPTAIIQTNGLTKSFIYDENFEKVVEINEYGIIEDFVTYTKLSSKLFKSNENISDKRMQTKISIKCENGYHELFNPDVFLKRWELNNGEWKLNPGVLELNTRLNDASLKSLMSNVSGNSYGVRFHYKLKNTKSSIKINNFILRSVDSYPDNGEILYIIENKRMIVWINGVLVYDKLSVEKIDLNLKLNGNIIIRDLLVFDKPKVEVLYYNIIGELIQKINLETETSAFITHILYDEIGRKSIITKRSRLHEPENFLVAFRAKFITNDDPNSENSVWKTGKLGGEVEKFAFMQYKYDNSPLENKLAIGLPGEEFSVNGKYSKKFKYDTDMPFDITQKYPKDKYFYRVEIGPGNVERVLIYDMNEKILEDFVKINNSKNLRTSYKYDSDGNLIEMLPPMHYCDPNYHDNCQPFTGTKIEYNENGDVIAKETDDTGRVEFIRHKETGSIQFAIYYKKGADLSIDYILVFNYDNAQRLSSTGLVHSSLYKNNSVHNVIVNLKEPPKSISFENHQLFYYSDYEKEPILRDRVKRIITLNHGKSFTEEIVKDHNKNVISKRIAIQNDENEMNTLTVNKVYFSKRLKVIEYPIKMYNDRSFKLIYRHDALGRVTGIGIPGHDEYFAKFKYNSFGQIESEHHLPDSSDGFVNNKIYNEPGFLTKIKNKFLTEIISYDEENSYGGFGYGDGTVTKTDFNAKWHYFAQKNFITLKPTAFVNNKIDENLSSKCFYELKKSGYIDSFNHMTKILYKRLDSYLSQNCRNNLPHLIKILDANGFPVRYGHKYDYGQYQELVKAKYFAGMDDDPKPLTPISFVDESTDVNKSIKLFNLLSANDFITTSNPKGNENYIHGKKSTRSITEDDNNSMNKLMLESFVNGKMIDSKRFLETYNNWNDDSRLESCIKDCKEIFDQIQSYKFNELFNQTFHGTIKTLYQHFGNEIGQSPADLEYFDIDMNGNQKVFGNIYTTYTLNYIPKTNQISNVTIEENNESKSYEMLHDSRGNVIKAEHKNIDEIVYDKVFNRPKTVRLSNMLLEFDYDASGERVAKRVFNRNGNLQKEIIYVRDETGKCLVEKQTTYMSDGSSSDVMNTAYIYGPNGLVGFIRRDEFYSVISDHAGSTRLVIKNGEVVAAYDYKAYGGLMRKFVAYPDADISYLYTGQEWDKELKLYNYHVRFYDPTIGRFYQIDPKEQYASPYKYAGNSPISNVDPNGEFAEPITFIILIGLIGAYFGGVGVTNSWNPAEWDWKNPELYVGLLAGFVSGAGLGLAGITLATAAIGVGVSYLSMAAKSGTFNLLRWNWRSPELYATAFSGFASGASVIKGINDFRSAFNLISTTKYKVLFVGAISAYGGLSLINEGIKNKWDFSKPEMLLGLLNSITGALDLSSAVKGVQKFVDRFEKIAKNIKANVKHIRQLKKILQAARLVADSEKFSLLLYAFKLGTGISVATLLGFANNWDLTKITTYQGLISGYTLGLKLVNTPVSMVKDYKKNVELEESINAKDAVEEGPLFELDISDEDKPHLLFIDDDPTDISPEIDPNRKITFITKSPQNPVLSNVELSEPESTNVNVNKDLQIAKKSLYSSRMQFFDFKLFELFLSKHPLLLAKEIALSSLKNMIKNGYRLTSEIVYKHIIKILDEAEDKKSFLENRFGEFIKSEINTVVDTFITSGQKILENSVPLFGYNKTLNIGIELKNLTYNLQYAQFDVFKSNQKILYEYFNDTRSNSIPKMTPSYLGVFDVGLKHSPDSVLFDPVWENLVQSVTHHLREQNHNKKNRNRRSINQFDRIQLSIDNCDYQVNNRITSQKHEFKSYCITTWIQKGIDKLRYITNSSKIIDEDHVKMNSVTESVDTNGTILLIDLFVRKITGQKFINTIERSLSTDQVQSISLNLIDEYENILQQTAQQIDIGLEYIDFDSISVLSKLTKVLSSGEYSKISKILYESGKLTFMKADCKNTHKMFDCLSKNLSQMLSESKSTEVLRNNLAGTENYTIPDSTYFSGNDEVHGMISGSDLPKSKWLS